MTGNICPCRSVAGRFLELLPNPAQLHELPLQAVEEEVDDRGGEEGEHLRDDEAADDGNAKRLAQFRAYAHADGQREAAEQSGHCCHHDGPEAEQAGLINGFHRRQTLFALSLQGKVDSS